MLNCAGYALDTDETQVVIPHDEHEAGCVHDNSDHGCVAACGDSGSSLASDNGPEESQLLGSESSEAPAPPASSLPCVAPGPKDADIPDPLPSPSPEVFPDIPEGYVTRRDQFALRQKHADDDKAEMGSSAVGSGKGKGKARKAKGKKCKARTKKHAKGKASAARSSGLEKLRTLRRLSGTSSGEVDLEAESKTAVSKRCMDMEPDAKPSASKRGRRMDTEIDAKPPVSKRGRRMDREGDAEAAVSKRGRRMDREGDAEAAVSRRGRRMDREGDAKAAVSKRRRRMDRESDATSKKLTRTGHSSPKSVAKNHTKPKCKKASEPRTSSPKPKVAPKRKPTAKSTSDGADSVKPPKAASAAPAKKSAPKISYTEPLTSVDQVKVALRTLWLQCLNNKRENGHEGPDSYPQFETSAPVRLCPYKKKMHMGLKITQLQEDGCLKTSQPHYFSMPSPCWCSLQLLGTELATQCIHAQEFGKHRFTCIQASSFLKKLLRFSNNPTTSTAIVSRQFAFRIHSATTNWGLNFATYCSSHTYRFQPESLLAQGMFHWKMIKEYGHAGNPEKVEEHKEMLITAHTEAVRNWSS